ncbi:MAG: flagellar biosynthesis regulator FlaF [Nitrospirae bacterium]|nr:flagellar biosynthesis regulator FlaF [Nitrospirota bacterium]
MLATHLDAYRKVQKTSISGRELEASVLTQAAFKLTACQNNWEASDHNVMLEDALIHNQRIWTILQSELAKDDNPLPQQIKDDLLSLSIFIDKRTFDIMAFPDPAKLSILININLNIAAGLRGSTGG